MSGHLNHKCVSSLIPRVVQFDQVSAFARLETSLVPQIMFLTMGLSSSSSGWSLNTTGRVACNSYESCCDDFKGSRHWDCRRQT